MRPIEPDSPDFGPLPQVPFAPAQQGPSSGKIRSITDIPNFRKLLMTKLDNLTAIPGS